MGEERPPQGFSDHTVATSFERFCASIEKALHSWLPQGKSLESVRQRAADASEDGCGLVCLRTAVLHRLPFRSEPYTLTLYLPTAEQQPCPHGAQPARAAAAHWWPAAGGPEQRPHRLQRWFATAAFLTLVPQSYSGRVLAASSEGQTLVSGLAVALSNCRVAWPAFVPVHDALRDAVAGVAAAGPASVFLHADGMPAIRAAKQPPVLLQVEGQLAAFAEQIGASAPQAATACRQVLAGSDVAAFSTTTMHTLRLSARRSYRVPEHSTEGDDGSEHDAMTLWVDDWDVGAPWLPWASYSDPIGGLELDLEWHDVSAAAALQQPGSAWLAASADVWQLHVLAPQQQAARSIFALQATERKREHLLLPLPEAGDQQQGSAASPATSAPEGSFASMARCLLPRLPDAGRAKAIGQLASAEWWETRGLTVPRAPPEAALTDVVRDLFAAMALPPSFGGGGSGGGFGSTLGLASLSTGVGAAAAVAGALQRQHQSSSSVASDAAPGAGDGRASPAEAFARLSRTAPVESLLARLALHALVFGNLRAVAILWGRFVRELRFSHWETLTPLPRMPGGAGAAETGAQPPDLGACLLQQKLQMVALCIARRAAARQSGATTPTFAGAPSKRWQLPSDLSSEPADAATLESLDGWDADDLTLNGSSTPNGCLSHASSDATAAAAAASAQTMPREDAAAVAMLTPRSDASHYSSASEGGFSSADGLCSPKSGTSHGVSAKLGSPQTGDQMAAASTRHAMDGIEQAAPSRPRQPPANPDMLEGWVSQTARQDGTAAAEQRRHGQQQHSSEQQHNSEQQQSSEQQQPAQPTAPLVTGLDDACSDPDAVPTGVAAPMMGGEYLLLYPERPINVPELQEGQAMTEDMQLEVEAALSSLGEGEGAAEVRARLSAPGLASDMAAFKAANPGACLADFLRWHSPRDWLPHPPPGRLSPRMAHPGNAWAALWAAAPATAAAQQAPLMDAEAQGERALHLLETAPPGAALRQLLVVALSAAASTLAAAPAAVLPTAAAALLRLSDRMGSAFNAAELGAEGFGGRRRPNAAAAHAREAVALAPLLPLLTDLAAVESIVVAGESLLRRLPGQPALADRVLAAAQAASLAHHQHQSQPQQPPEAPAWPQPPSTPALPSAGGAPPERPASAPPLQQPDGPAHEAAAPKQRPPASAPGSAAGSAPGSAPGSQPDSAPGSPPSSRASSQELLRPMAEPAPLQQPAEPQTFGGAGPETSQPTLQQQQQPPAAARGVNVAAAPEREALAQLMRGGGAAGGGAGTGVPDWGECLESETVVEAAPLRLQPGAAGQPPHRFYIQATPTSMRLASVVVSED